MTLCTHDPCRGSRSASICQSVCQSMCQYVCQSMCQMTHVLECIYVSIYVSNDSCLYVSIYVADDSCLYVSIYMSKDISLQARTQESCTRLDVYVSIGMHTSGCLCRVNAHVWMTITRQAYMIVIQTCASLDRHHSIGIHPSGCLSSQQVWMPMESTHLHGYHSMAQVCCSVLQSTQLHGYHSIGIQTIHTIHSISMPIEPSTWNFGVEWLEASRHAYVVW